MSIFSSRTARVPRPYTSPNSFSPLKREETGGSGARGDFSLYSARGGSVEDSLCAELLRKDAKGVRKRVEADFATAIKLEPQKRAGKQLLLPSEDASLHVEGQLQKVCAVEQTFKHFTHLLYRKGPPVFDLPAEGKELL